MPHKNHHESVATLLGQPALVQLLEKTCSDKSDKDRKVLREKIETQCKSFEGKGKLTVDDLYGVIKLQVKYTLMFFPSRSDSRVAWISKLS